MNKPSKIYSDTIEQKALDQYDEAMTQDCVVQGALMPDAHFGYTLPIGSVIATEGMTFPSFVGYDIGCGMSALPLSCTKQDVAANADVIFNQIYRDVPVGFNKHGSKQRWDGHQELLTKTTDGMQQRFKDKAGLQQIGTLGGGNHFIEIGCDENDDCWIIIHSGSRGVGHATATNYMKLASPTGKASEGFYGFDVDSQNGLDYIKDLAFCLEFALQNRKLMIQKVASILKKLCGGADDWSRFVNRNHNHAELVGDRWIHRKGATHAEDGMMGVIPGNMRDGSFIVKGKGDPDSMCSSSHGAGRVLGRKKAKEQLDLEDLKTTMGGVKAKVEASTLDESPMAYKNIFEVMDLQKDLVEVVCHVKPIINIKG
jgi:tRNA-splicing ligase RtcB